MATSRSRFARSPLAPAARIPPPRSARLEAEEPELFEALTTAVAGGYFLSPDVRDRLGYPGQQAQKLEDDFDQELLRR